MPEVIVSTVPSELLAADGEPQYTPIKGTDLLYMSNTANTIFMDTATQEYYALVSGRWFKTKALAEGPWSYVASNQLPKDFAKIPENSAKGFVLVNVADTIQAKEAVLDNSIPQTATIDRQKATIQVEYAGEPKFEKIPGTDLEYAVNTGKSVFKAGAKYYALDQGVWYEADSPNGPWTVSTTPPPKRWKRFQPATRITTPSTSRCTTPPLTPSPRATLPATPARTWTTARWSTARVTIIRPTPPPTPISRRRLHPRYGYAAAYDPYESSWGYQSSSYNPSSWLGPSLVGAGAGLAGGYAIWGNRNNYGGGYWGPGGYNNVNIDNSHNNVINPKPGQRPPGWQPGEKPGGRPGRPSTLPANKANLYNRPGNETRLASRPGQPATMPASGVVPGRPGPGCRRASGNPTCQARSGSRTQSRSQTGPGG